MSGLSKTVDSTTDDASPPSAWVPKQASGLHGMELNDEVWWVPPARPSLLQLPAPALQILGLRKDGRDGNETFDYEELGPLGEHALDLTPRFPGLFTDVCCSDVPEPSSQTSAPFSDFYPTLSNAPASRSALTKGPVHESGASLPAKLSPLPSCVCSPRRLVLKDASQMPSLSQEGTKKPTRTSLPSPSIRDLLAHIIPLAPSSALWILGFTDIDPPPPINTCLCKKEFGLHIMFDEQRRIVSGWSRDTCGLFETGIGHQIARFFTAGTSILATDSSVNFGTWGWSAKLSIFRVPATTNSQWLAELRVWRTNAPDVGRIGIFVGLFSAISVAEPTTVQATETSSLTVLARNGSLHPQPNSLLSDFRPTLFDALVNAPASRSVSLWPCAVYVNSDTWAWSNGMRLSSSLERVSATTARSPVLSLDVTIAPYEADTNSHLFLLLALQDSEYQLLFGNAICSQVVQSISLPTWQDPFGEYSCPRCVEELASGCTLPYFYGKHRLTLPDLLQGPRRWSQNNTMNY
ncbi:uncharacterized protein ARMOST_20262 [Armillaria ostoyae]|uniref:Uncharacterized protein n=1 Tax=Armillaria ostoyae TaxID=47428 RepID=A0A284S6V0_ARMOS|nr:uncharacterized protein ARMOST_20262 [Armillaria ostoyae]